MKQFAGLLWAVLVLPAVAAAEQPATMDSAEDFYSVCKDAGKEDFAKLACTGYIAGLRHGWTYGEVSGADSAIERFVDGDKRAASQKKWQDGGLGQTLCKAKQIKSNYQLFEIVMKYLRDNPAARSDEMAIVFRDSLNKAFGCLTRADLETYQKQKKEIGWLVDKAQAAEALIPASVPTCHVVGVTDGDTITVRCGTDEQMKVRLAEIDAPETGQAWGQKSKQYLLETIYDKDVRVSTVDHDRYGRSVAYVFYLGFVVQRMMLTTGLAWCYDQYAKSDWCEGDEQKARTANRQIWSDKSPVSPWEYRKARKG